MTPSPIHPIRFETAGPIIFAGIRKRHPFDAEPAALASQWLEFAVVDAIPHKVGESLYGIMCGIDTNGFEYMCAAEVSEFSETQGVKLPGRVRTSKETYAVFQHTGSFSSLKTMWREILNVWLPSSEFDSAHRPDFEKYAGDYDWNSGTGSIEIWIAVVSAQREALRHEMQK